MAMLLAIDTSNEYAGVALWDERGLRGEATWYAGRQHTEQVIAQLDVLLRHVGGDPAQLEAVAVATGPGSWSGLRASMSMAKSIAIGRRIPIIGVPTLDALAYGQRGRGTPVVAMVRLGRDRFAVAVYDGSGDEWARQGEFQAMDGRDVAHIVDQPWLVGDMPNGIDIAQTQRAGAADHQRRAAYVAELAWERHLREAYDDPVALEPIYLSHPVRSQ